MGLTKVSFLLALLLYANGNMPPPPKPDEVAKMARYIMRNAEWISVATISTQKSIKGYPYASLESVSDGPLTNSTGVPYMYVTDLEYSMQDLSVDNRCSIMTSLAQTDYCKQQTFDPEDPRCARLFITGKFKKVDKNTSEYKFGKNAVFDKHPSMRHLPKNHNFYVAKIDIEQIALFDSFGGVKDISVEDYFNANNTDSFRNENEKTLKKHT